METRKCLNGFWDFSMEVSMDTIFKEAFLPVEIEITDISCFGGDNEIIVIAENAKKYMYRDRKNWNSIGKGE